MGNRSLNEFVVHGDRTGIDALSARFGIRGKLTQPGGTDRATLTFWQTGLDDGPLYRFRDAALAILCFHRPEMGNFEVAGVASWAAGRRFLDTELLLRF